MTQTEIQNWLIERISAITGLDQTEIDPSGSFAEHGIGSKDAALLVSQLQAATGHKVSATIVWDYPTIEAVAKFVAVDIKSPVSTTLCTPLCSSDLRQK